MTRVRTAAVAGQFYPEERDTLLCEVRHYLEDAQKFHRPKDHDPSPKALIVPHAGYIYSAPIAASAYVKLHGLEDQIKRVILLGPSHRVRLDGLAVCSADCYETPLGRVRLDKELSQQILGMDHVREFDDPHIPEHSLEVHLPFLQTILKDFSLLPLVVGNCSPEQVGQVLESVWGGDETLFVISTDLSHYLDYASCQRLDQQTVQAIEQMNINAIGSEQACGRVPLKAMLSLAKARKMSVTTLDVRNSGDTKGPRDRVVGYGSWMITDRPVQASPHEAFSIATKGLIQRYGVTLLQLAAASIKRGISHGEPIKLDLASFPQALKTAGAAFVTIEKDGGKLRGCIGSLSAHQPLSEDIAQNAFKAGFKDPRFPALSEDELGELSLHISILSPAFSMSFDNEADLLAQLRPHKDGLIIQDGAKRALFLPSVWEKIPDKQMFLNHLRQKAGLAANHWSATFQAWRFVTEGIHSEQLDAPEKLWQDTPTS